MEAKQQFDARRRAGWTADSRPADELVSGYDVYEGGDDARVREFLEAKAHLTALKNAGTISAAQYTELLDLVAPRLKASDPDKFANHADTVTDPHKLQECARAVDVLEKVLSAHLDENVKIRQRASLGTFVEASFDYAKPYSGNDVVVALPIELDQSGATIALYEYGGKVCAAFYLRRVSLNFALKSGRPPNSAWYPGRDGNFETSRRPLRTSATPTASSWRRARTRTGSAPPSGSWSAPSPTRRARRSWTTPSRRSRRTRRCGRPCATSSLKNEGRTRPRPSVVAAIDDDALEDGDARKRALSVSSADEEEALVRCDDTSFALISAIARAVRGDASTPPRTRSTSSRPCRCCGSATSGPSRPSPSRRTACSASRRRARCRGRRSPSMRLLGATRRRTHGGR